MSVGRYLRFLGPSISAVRIAMVRTAVALGDAGKSEREPVARAAWAPGISVIIPERGTPELLLRALEHLQPALARVTEPTEVIVIVNGVAFDPYEEIKAKFPATRWEHHAEPLGFSGAIARGFALARFGGIYLHNSDIAIEPDTLETLLPWRAPSVFAVASQIFFDDASKRREETGWGDLTFENWEIRVFNREPEPDGHVRSGLYASGGSSLFDAELLRRFAAETEAYAPFYWEDTEWGVRAWRSGLEVLFQPKSIAWHRHRATVSRYYPKDTIDRIVGRNALLFQFRNLPSSRACKDLPNARYESLKELTSLSTLNEIRRVRAGARRAAFPDTLPDHKAQSIYARPAPKDGRPLILVVSPFHIMPPRHGGAWRIWRLCMALKERWRFMLLSDEGTRYGPEAWADLGPYESVHWTFGRIDGAAERSARIRSHSREYLQQQLEFLTAVHQPDLVQIEHIELAGLRPPPGVPSLLTAHDVLIESGRSEEDKLEKELLARFDAVVACSVEDAGLLAPIHASIVPNGAVVEAAPISSAGNWELLFAGPFRYEPNLQGIRQFLELVYPELRRRFPQISLSILAGDAGRQKIAGDALFTQPGVHVEDAVNDVRPWLKRSALTLNPLSATRGSSLKLIESLGAGRVCVTTRDGARGFVDANLPGLVIVNSVAEMLDPIARLLADEPARVAVESSRRDALQAYSWESAAQEQAAIYNRLLKRQD